MKIAVIGAGNIGETLGQKWAAQGHQVTYGVRDVTEERYQPLLAAGENVGLATPAEAVVAADVVLLALPGVAVISLLEVVGPQLDHKIVIDATNRIGEPVMNNIEFLAAAAPDAALFRAFNTLGWENFAAPELGGEQIDLFYCGDEERRDVAETLIVDAGLRPVYVGGRERAGLLDSLTQLWFALAYEQGYGRRLALKLLAP
jgi:8-hydroxy-5-deazaflavin:NADPH oxidoreductase